MAYNPVPLFVSSVDIDSVVVRFEVLVYDHGFISRAAVFLCFRLPLQYAAQPQPECPTDPGRIQHPGFGPSRDLRLIDRTQSESNVVSRCPVLSPWIPRSDPTKDPYEMLIRPQWLLGMSCPLGTNQPITLSRVSEGGGI